MVIDGKMITQPSKWRSMVARVVVIGGVNYKSKFMAGLFIICKFAHVNKYKIITLH